MPEILLLMGLRGLLVHDKFSLMQVHDMLRIRPISHCVDISYVFLYLTFRPLDISINAFKVLTLLITYTHL